MKWNHFNIHIKSYLQTIMICQYSAESVIIRSPLIRSSFEEYRCNILFHKLFKIIQYYLFYSFFFTIDYLFLINLGHFRLNFRINRNFNLHILLYNHRIVKIVSITLFRFHYYHIPAQFSPFFFLMARFYLKFYLLCNLNILSKIKFYLTNKLLSNSQIQNF